MGTQTYTKEVRSVLGHSLQNLESASMRLQKFATLERSGGHKSELSDVASVASKNARMFSIRKIDFINAESFTMKLMGRMMINQAEGLYENAGLKLHRFFGYPVIPGSALKGIARHAAWWEWSETNDDSLACEIADIFGYPTGENELDKALSKLGYEDSKGKVSFLEAQPANQDWCLVVDILNPHHGCDTKNPIPVTFPAIEKGALFNFSVIAESEKLRAKAVKWLKLALEEDGVGSKTAAGYGWFKEVN